MAVIRVGGGMLQRKRILEKQVETIVSSDDIRDSPRQHLLHDLGIEFEWPLAQYV